MHGFQVVLIICLLLKCVFSAVFLYSFDVRKNFASKVKLNCISGDIFGPGKQQKITIYKTIVL